ncbi:DUF2939 domain-containing protein [Hymenobacter sp. DG25A]|uniref:DUF2939 domain-containing protein n=1 Tax=Hymenobacter sp. DG25A TaxID=1385663 RepID=UPI0006BDB9D0|nr:DUF2939 domain-containing protein [Hymenobacter sp. DG25A]ALD22135.1 hypothetical protein AM218_14115 [Hymenobacter sp. DG25A]
MKKLLIIAVLAALGIGGYLYYKRLTGGPEYALIQAVKAAKMHDVATFEHYVDLHTLTDNLVEQMTDQRVMEAIPGGSSMLMQGALRLLKPQLGQVARQEIVRYIEANPDQAAARPALPVKVLGMAGSIISPDSRFKGIKYNQRQGDEALVGLEFTQPRYDTTLVLEVKLQNQGDHWQVKQITNGGQLARHVARLEKERNQSR